ncbi:MAG: thiamine phosphate synthase [Deltaproteobacteria bacterium]|nr:thiamine phosphate synthase [Deltaproteobacteria bacterium]
MAQMYAIVSSLDKARFFLEQQVPWLQLRLKETPLQPHLAEISRWAAKYPRTRLVINDDPDFARQAGAWGVHLGQEDLTRLGWTPGRAEGLGLGISTHTPQEIARALALSPDYIGFGPIFPTSSKQVAHPPQGVGRLAQVVQQAGAMGVPVAAIGGIHWGNLPQVTATKVGMVALLSACDNITKAEDIRNWMDMMA